MVVGCILLIIFEMIGTKYIYDLKSKIHKSIYKLEKNIGNNKYINYMVAVTDDIVLSEVVGDMIKSSFGLGGRIYSIKNFSKEEIELIDEDILLITDSQERLLEIIKEFENKNNKILGILTTFNITKDLESKLNKYNLQVCLKS